MPRLTPLERWRRIRWKWRQKHGEPPDLHLIGSVRSSSSLLAHEFGSEGRKARLFFSGSSLTIAIESKDGELETVFDGALEGLEEMGLPSAPFFLDLREQELVVGDEVLIKFQDRQSRVTRNESWIEEVREYGGTVMNPLPPAPEPESLQEAKRRVDAECRALMEGAYKELFAKKGSPPTSKELSDKTRAPDRTCRDYIKRIQDSTASLIRREEEIAAVLANKGPTSRELLIKSPEAAGSENPEDAWITEIDPDQES